jgi:hypothetical protein
VIRAYMQVKHPLEVKQFGSFWAIVLKDTPHNVVHNDDCTFTVYGTKELAEEALKSIKDMAKIKFRKVLKVTE